MAHYFFMLVQVCKSRFRYVNMRGRLVVRATTATLLLQRLLLHYYYNDYYDYYYCREIIERGFVGCFRKLTFCALSVRSVYDLSFPSAGGVASCYLRV